MAEPRTPPKSRAGWINWGATIADCALLTEPQWRALNVLMLDAPRTTTKKAKTARDTIICDHEVRLNTVAVAALEKHGLVATRLHLLWTEVGVTARGMIAFDRHSLERRAERVRP